MRKRILQFLTYAGIGGTQRMLLEFLRHASHDQYEFAVCVLLKPGLVNEQVAAMHLEHTSLNMRGYWDLSAWWKFYRFIKGKQFDLICTYGLKAHIIGRIVGKLAGIPANITSIQSVDPWRKWHHTLLDMATSRFTDCFIAISEAARQAAHQRERIPLNKIVTIPNGIDVPAFTTRAVGMDARAISRYREQFGIPANAPVIGIIASFRSMKGHKTIVDALPRIQSKFPEIRCLFVGDEFVKEKSYKQDVYDYVRAKQLEQAVIFTGPRHDIPELLSILDVFLLPSLWEGLPISLLEAMALQKPIVASAVGGIPEIIEPDKTGMLIPPQNPDALAEAVIFLLEHPAFAQNMGRAGYEKVQQDFALESVVARIEAVYERLLTNSKNYCRFA